MRGPKRRLQTVRKHNKIVRRLCYVHLASGSLLAVDSHAFLTQVRIRQQKAMLLHHRTAHVKPYASLQATSGVGHDKIDIGCGRRFSKNTGRPLSTSTKASTARRHCAMVSKCARVCRVRKPTVLATTAPWIHGLNPHPMTAAMREYLGVLRDHKSVHMVKKYRDGQGRPRVVPSLVGRN